MLIVEKTSDDWYVVPMSTERPIDLSKSGGRVRLTGGEDLFLLRT